VIKPLDFASITLRTAKQRVVLNHQSGSFTSETEGVDKHHAARIIEALENLRPEFAVHTGPPKPNQGLSKPTLSVTYQNPTRGKQSRVVRIGSAHMFQGMGGFHARAGNSQATFAISQGRVQQLLDLL
jgi:hypothetical protein